jgi:hypothetical protein
MILKRPTKTKIRQLVDIVARGIFEKAVEVLPAVGEIESERRVLCSLIP